MAHFARAHIGAEGITPSSLKRKKEREEKEGVKRRGARQIKEGIQGSNKSLQCQGGRGRGRKIYTLYIGGEGKRRKKKGCLEHDGKEINFCQEEVIESKGEEKISPKKGGEKRGFDFFRRVKAKKETCLCLLRGGGEGKASRERRERGGRDGSYKLSRQKRDVPTESKGGREREEKQKNMEGRWQQIPSTGDYGRRF